jgi:hypothetical protein
VTKQQAGLTINILKLSTGTVESLTHQGDELMDVIEAKELAAQIEEAKK